jgi:hypothetical protein
MHTVGALPDVFHGPLAQVFYEAEHGPLDVYYPADRSYQPFAYLSDFAGSSDPVSATGLLPVLAAVMFGQMPVIEPHNLAHRHESCTQIRGGGIVR